MQHIPVVCPHCETRYQLQPELRGKMMRCPNPLCREIFLVQEERTASPPEPEPPVEARPRAAEAGPGQWTGTVGELVPFLPAEPLGPTVVPRGKETAQAAPDTESILPEPEEMSPPVEPPTEPAEAEAAPETPVESGSSTGLQPEAEPQTDGPAEMPAGLWEAPPIRQPLAGEDWLGIESPVFEETAPAEITQAEEPPVAASTRRRNFWLAAGLLGLMAVTVGLGFLLVQGQRGDLEEERFLAASEEYQKKNFSDAARMFHYLELDFPDSPRRPAYHFLSQLASLRDPIHSTQTDPKVAVQALQDFLAFVKEEADNPLLDERQADVWESLYRAAEDLTSFAELHIEKETRFAQELLGFAGAVLEESSRYQAPKKVNAEFKLSQAAATVESVKTRLGEWQHRQVLLDLLELLIQQPVGNVVERGHALVQQHAQTQPELTNDPAVLQLLARLPPLHRAGIKYIPLALKARPAPQANNHVSLYWSEPVQAGTSGVGQDKRPVLAMAGGVLYAVDPAQGKVRWVQRVGVDTPSLPVWLPATPVLPERLLVLCSDQPSLRAVVAETGEILWEQELEEPCLGQPVLVGTRALVALRDGRVSEFDTITGKQAGYFQVDQSLTGWGTHQPGTPLVYFPADSYCVYVLDVDQRRCANILYSKHPNYALRGRPLVASQPNSGSKGTGGLLLLTQTAGTKSMKLRAFALPLEEGESEDLLPPATFSGWPWFAPYQTPEEMALITDAGQFAAYGFGQPLSHDPALFSLFKDDLARQKYAGLPPRAQVVHAGAGSYWVLAGGKLFRLESGVHRDVGPKPASPWEAPLAPLGSPLQASQTRQAKTGETAMFLLTQKGNANLCLFSALETPHGSIQWQQRLGLMGDQYLGTLGNQVLAVDREGDVFLFDPQRFPENGDGEWLDAGTLISKKWNSGGIFLQVFPRPDREEVFILAGSDSGEPVKLHLRHIQQGKTIQTREWNLSLPSPLAGTAAVADSTVVLPLANGSLLRHSQAGSAKTSLLNWRAGQADPDAVGHVLWLGGEDFLVTDGSRGVRLVHWPEGQAEQLRESLQLDSRVAHAPQLLPAAEGKPGLVVLAGADNGITLLQTNPLQIVRQWPGEGTITAGPFVREGSIGYIVEDQELIWLQPNQQKPHWKYTCAAPIVGEPQLAGKHLLVADRSGRFTLLDTETGQPHGAGATLSATAVPAVAPVPWTPGRFFAPLTDGTIVLLKIH